MGFFERFILLRSGFNWFLGIKKRPEYVAFCHWKLCDIEMSQFVWVSQYSIHLRLQVWSAARRTVPLISGLYLSDILNRVFYRSCAPPVLIFLLTSGGHKWSDCLVGIWRGRSSWFLTFLPPGPSRLSNCGPALALWQPDELKLLNIPLPADSAGVFIGPIKHAGMWNWLSHLTGKANDVWKVYLDTRRHQWK